METPPPFQRPQANARRALLHVFLIVILGELAVALFLRVKVVHTFGEVFASFGKELPPLTAFVMGSSFYLVLLALAALAAGAYFWEIALQKQEPRKGLAGALPRVILSCVFILLALGLALTVFSLFLPMFELGNAVGH